jgi:hypothetical protein
MMVMFDPLSTSLIPLHMVLRVARIELADEQHDSAPGRESPRV